MQASHSRIESHGHCPYKYDLHYNQGIRTIPNDDPTNALFLGTALHTGLEKGVDAGIKEYYMSYPVISDAHINEAIKLEYLIPRAAAMLPKGEHEIKIDDNDFVGYIDLLAPVEVQVSDDTSVEWFDIYDFKYSNNVSHYKDSPQLHLYKYFWEKNNPGKKIRNLYFLFVPKVNIKQKKTEDLMQFRKRIQSELNNVEPKLMQIEFNLEKVLDFLFGIKCILEALEFPKKPNWLCNYCEFKDYCERGIDYMLLPKNERRNIEKVEKKVVWLYGSPFSGKTTFANKFPDPLMLNTDGNIKFVDAPFIPIKDEVTVEGRMTKRKLAWETFKEVIAELERKENDFKTIIVDLLEDTYEHCRLYMYAQMGITHESDDSFRAWDKVRTEFLSTLKKLMNLNYENIILISHEDTSKDITKKGGDKITSIKPNLNDKVSTKVAGMVDIVARVVADDTKRVLSFKTNEVIFGGGRLSASTNEIDLDYDEFLSVYEEANKNAVAKLKGEISEPKKSDKAESGRKGRSSKKSTPEPEKSTDDENMSSDSGSNVTKVVEKTTEKEPEKEPEKEEAPVRKRRSRTADVVITRDAEGRAKVTPAPESEAVDEEPAKEEPKTRTRKRRGTTTQDGFMNIPDGIDEELPFN